MRDFVLGVKLVDGTGQMLNFGGQVMKNVAGYDVSRLIAGSLGTLGVIAEVTLKVLPKPVAETMLGLRLRCDGRDSSSQRMGRPAVADFGLVLARRPALAAPVRRAGGG